MPLGIRLAFLSWFVTVYTWLIRPVNCTAAKSYEVPKAVSTSGKFAVERWVQAHPFVPEINDGLIQ